MRTAIATVVTLAFVGIPAVASEAGDRAAECILQFSPPDYPPLARSTSTQGLVVAEVRVPAASEELDVRFLDGHRLLNPSVERAMLESEFNPACAGQSILLHFVFELGEVTAPARVVVTRPEPDLNRIRSRRGVIDFTSSSARASR